MAMIDFLMPVFFRKVVPDVLINSIPIDICPPANTANVIIDKRGIV